MLIVCIVSSWRTSGKYCSTLTKDDRFRVRTYDQARETRHRMHSSLLHFTLRWHGIRGDGGREQNPQWLLWHLLLYAFPPWNCNRCCLLRFYFFFSPDHYLSQQDEQLGALFSSSSFPYPVGIYLLRVWCNGAKGNWPTSSVVTLLQSFWLPFCHLQAYCCSCSPFIITRVRPLLFASANNRLGPPTLEFETHN